MEMEREKIQKKFTTHKLNEEESSREREREEEVTTTMDLKWRFVK